jgi:hypothetical protein
MSTGSSSESVGVGAPLLNVTVTESSDFSSPRGYDGMCEV